MSRWLKERQAVLEYSILMEKKGLVVGTSGNVSCRLPPLDGRGIMAITPSRRYYDTLSAEDIVVVDFDAEPVEGDLVPSAETLLHAAIYIARPDVWAVFHTHSVYASALAVAGKEIPPILDDQVVFLGGSIQVAPYGLPASEELSRNVTTALGERNAALLANHGTVAVGKDLRRAMTAAELVEKAAQVYVMASSLGKVNLLPPDIVEVGQAFFRMLKEQE